MRCPSDGFIYRGKRLEGGAEKMCTVQNEKVYQLIKLPNPARQDDLNVEVYCTEHNGPLLSSQQTRRNLGRHVGILEL